MLIEYIFSAILLGIIVAIPPGSVTIVACQRSLQYGFKNSLVFIFGSSCADIFYIILVYIGIATFISSNILYKIILWFMCGIILIILGIISLMSIKKQDNKKITNFQTNSIVTFISGILITLSNPMTIIGWLAIAGNFFLIWIEKSPYAKKDIGVFIILFIMFGVLLWFIPLNFIVSRLKKRMNEKIQKFLIFISSICLIVFGIIGIYFSINESLTLI